MSHFFHPSLSLILACALAFMILTGCSSSTLHDTEASVDVALLESHRSRYLLSDEPVGAITLSELRQVFSDMPQEEMAAVSEEVLVAGRVAGLDAGDSDTDPDPMWVRGSAQFRLLEPDSEPAHSDPQHGHDPHSGDHSECEFCKKMKAAQAPVIVQFLDPSGTPLSIDARTLLPLKGHDHVVVKGVARKQAGSILVTAKHIFIHQDTRSQTTAYR